VSARIAINWRRRANYSDSNRLGREIARNLLDAFWKTTGFRPAVRTLGEKPSGVLSLLFLTFFAIAGLTIVGFAIITNVKFVNYLNFGYNFYTDIFFNSYQLPKSSFFILFKFFLNSWQYKNLQLKELAYMYKKIL